MEMCEDCKALVDAGRKVQPHANLEAVGEFRQYGRSSQANEQDYVCKACGKKWVRETGNSGYGWF